MTLAPGTRLGPYDVVAAIGAGGMGEVYRARDSKLGRDVAIKVLPAALAHDSERLARFEREARLLASLNHPNIAQIHSLENATLAGGTTAHFLAMELVPGEDLANRLRSGALPLDDAIATARQIADGLEEAHEHGIIHRDLKPANVILTPDGKVKILDFGLAKAFGSDGSTSSSPEISHSPTMTHQATEAGMILGTAAYMSPEQARGKAVDRRADIWSFGVVLFEMLSGTRLFAGETVSDTLAAVLRQDVDWKALPKDLLPSHRRLIERCLERDPKRRLRDIGEARLILEGVDSGARTSAATASEMPSAGSGRVRGSLIAAGIVVAAAIGGMAIGRASVPAPAAQTFMPRTFVAQAIFNARFMPDGQTMIISSALTGNATSLFESRPGAVAPRPFGPPRTHLLSISKSGELAVLTNCDYLGQRLMRGTLARMTIDGAPRAISEDVREADWLPDGSDLAVIRDTGGRDQLEFPIGQVVHRVAGYLSDPRVSPDGTRVAFMEHPTKWDDRGFVKVVDRAGAVITVAGEFPSEEGLAWSPDGRSVRFSAAGTAYASIASNVYVASAKGGGPSVPLLSSAGNLYLQDMAADGRMAVTREDLVLGVAAKGARQDAERELTPLDQAWRPKLSGDGTFVVFGDGRGGTDYAVGLRNVDGSPPAQLGDGNPGDISTDGRWVTATLFSSGRCVVYPTGAGTMVPIDPGPLQACQTAIFFPDGKSVLLTGNEPGKPTRAYRAAFPGGKPEALLAEGLIPQGISMSGQRVLVQDPSRGFQVYETGGATSPVKGLLPDDVLVEWAADEKTVVVADSRGIPALLYQVRLDTGLRTKLGEMAPADRAGLINVIPTAYRDGGRQYVYSYVRRVSTLYLVNAVR